MSTAPLESLDSELLLLEIPDEVDPCEGVTHSRGYWGHVPTDGASYLVAAACGRCWLACAGWVKYMRAYPGPDFDCSAPVGCGGVHRIDSLSTVPLPT